MNSLEIGRMSRKARREYYSSKVSHYCPSYDDFKELHDWFDSPIEELFYWAFKQKSDDKYGFVTNNYNGHECQCKVIYIIPQVDFKDLPYRVDFVIGGNYETENGLSLIVECDGHDYHSSKEQIINDNKRQREIENLGYTFIRFSGSEIYNNVEKCVEETFNKIEFLRKHNHALKEGEQLGRN